MKRRRFFEALTAALLAVLMIGGGFALAAPPEGKGPKKNGGGGGDDGGTTDPVLPPIEYKISRCYMPSDGTGYLNFNDMNNAGDCVGYYQTEGGPRAWLCLFDPGQESHQAINLNDIGVLSPTGYENWPIASAVGLNDYGDIVGYIESPDGTIRRGCVLHMSTLELTVLPEPDGGVDYYYARRINQAGDVLASFVRTDGTWGAYLCNAYIHSTPQEIDVNLEAPAATDFNGNGEVVGTDELGYVFVYRDGVTSYLDVPNNTRGVHINDSGTICSAYDEELQVGNNKNNKEWIARMFFVRDYVTVEPVADGDGKRPSGINSNEFVSVRDWNPDLFRNETFLYNGAWEWGSVNVDAIVTRTNADWTPTMYAEFKINDNGYLGCGQLADKGIHPNGTEGVVILTPYEYLQ